MNASSLRFPLLAALLAMLAACLFLPGLGGGFIFDDKPNIIENTVLHLTSLKLDDVLYAAYSFQPGHGSRSLSMLSFALDYLRGGGLDPQVFKTTNLLIHALTTLALALLLRRLLTAVQWPARRAATGALIFALLWAIHPLQVSSVLYVVQRMQTLCTLFMVLALWAYLAMRQAQMAGLRSRQYGVLAVLFWALGFAAKEDAVLLPLYAWVLELTVLRFRAAQPLLATVLRKGYLWLVVVGVVVYLLVVVPHFWRWQAYPGRDFDSWERLLTQGRVLVMYLGQIVLPMPGRMPFVYDDLSISRSLWQPAATLPAWLLVFGLLAWAWRWRTNRPLFAFGVLLFFAGHFITSNVINLELAFEHRNHLPLIGAVLAIGDLCMAACQRWAVPHRAGYGLLGLAIIGLGTATGVRAHTWGDPLRQALETVKISPHSERAWLQLGGVYASRIQSRADNPSLDLTIATYQKGAAATGSATLLSNVVTFKTIRGNVTPADWEKFLTRLQQVPMNAQNRRIIWVMLNNVDREIPLDRGGVLRVIESISSRTGFRADEYLRIGAYIHNETREPGKALPYLRRAVEKSPPGDPDIDKLLTQLRAAGRGDWVQELEKLPRASPKR
ncbi:hypothetical protein ABB34_03740 [Stenotrophomonas daejeonensis]|uniref:Transmembrane protein n=1 Tax=Stenotrophomonas daejeonensis TaxID=659018 RepID=A0A0R0EBK1_9GAMM|nr:hypothetical protein [Stenotrophomonas daejeonensis]KRG87706.1 hypothetical protein ABB34_03740 [Stenotrophomonas daejeonensis]